MQWKHDQQYDAQSHSGHHVALDGDAAHHLGGPSPMELVLMALCGCNRRGCGFYFEEEARAIYRAHDFGRGGAGGRGSSCFLPTIHLTYHVNAGVSPEGDGRRSSVVPRTNTVPFREMLEKAAKIDYVITYGDPA